MRERGPELVTAAAGQHTVSARRRGGTYPVSGLGQTAGEGAQRLWTAVPAAQLWDTRAAAPVSVRTPTGTSAARLVTHEMPPQREMGVKYQDTNSCLQRAVLTVSRIWMIFLKDHCYLM